MALCKESERHKFEMAYRAEWPEATGLSPRKFDLDEDGLYESFSVEIAFQMWLAAKASALEEAAALCADRAGIKGQEIRVLTALTSAENAIRALKPQPQQEPS